MPEKPKPEKFRITVRGKTTEFEVPPSTIDMNHPLLSDLQTKLLRMRPEEELKLPHSHFDELSKDPFELTIIGEVAIVNGCNVLFDELISKDPDIYGYVFTRRDDVPLLDWIEPEGGKQ